MSTTPVNSSSVFSGLGLTGSAASSSSSAASAAAAAATTAINEQDFLHLLTTQLKDQDPTHPVSNADFFSQIAQFSTVSGINQLNGSFSQLASQLAASQTLQAASLVGQSVLVPGSAGQLTSAGLYGTVAVPVSGDVQVGIYNSAGNLVNTLDLGTHSAGTVPFTWNGQDANGAAMPTGTYTIKAAVGSGSSAQAASTEVAVQVLSVLPNTGSGVELNLQGMGQVPLSSIQQIL